MCWFHSEDIITWKLAWCQSYWELLADQATCTPVG
jgi:hypothetical protein